MAMTTTTTTVFVCDQCGKKSRRRGMRPAVGWARLEHSDRYAETIEVYHMCGHECYETWIEANQVKKQVNNDTWVLWVEAGEGVTAWPRYPLPIADDEEVEEE